MKKNYIMVFKGLDQSLVMPSAFTLKISGNRFKKKLCRDNGASMVLKVFDKH